MAAYTFGVFAWGEAPGDGLGDGLVPAAAGERGPGVDLVSSTSPLAPTNPWFQRQPCQQVVRSKRILKLLTQVLVKPRGAV